MRYGLSDECILAFCRLGVAGLAPRAPGTWGSAVACVLAPFIFLPFGIRIRVTILVFLFFTGAWAAGRAEKILEQKDPREVVIDELVGVWLALLPFAHPDLTVIFIAFIFFRIFDIVKPWPVGASESWLPGGYGVMTDDVAAGIISMFCMLALEWSGIMQKLGVVF